MADQIHPPGYIKTESKIEGIEIFKPAPPKEAASKDVTFKCPQCGANTAYSVEDGGLVCAYCGYYEKPDAVVVGKRAEQFEFKVDTLQRLAQGWGEERLDISCQSCGAVVSVPPKTISTTCPFCGSNKILQQQAAQNDIRPRYILPFKIDLKAVREATQEWLGSSWMTPAELKHSALLQEFTPIYLPYWTFDSTCAADWKAEVGHHETERYFDGKKWQTRTKVKWRWESGHFQKIFDDLLIPGTARLSQKHLVATSGYRLSDISEYDPKYLAGMHAKSYDIQLEDAWETARKEMRDETKQGCMHQASTQMIRNFSMALDFSDESWRYTLLPAYISVYRHNNQPFQLIANGQTGKVSGQRPVDWQKVWLVIALCLIPGGLLGILGLLTLLFGGIGAVIGGIGFFLLVIGLVIAFIIFQQAQAMDDL
ncbi:MAG: hypothetical protein ACK2UW_00785 [Anaerolineales bacterium]|jgi:predicted RNA-binding Zn-ribbon protein involved in translation (DUF1610 family)